MRASPALRRGLRDGGRFEAAERSEGSMGSFVVLGYGPRQMRDFITAQFSAGSAPAVAAQTCLLGIGAFRTDSI